MKTRPATDPDAPDAFDPVALDTAMKAHPVVATTITRVADRARAAEAARDEALVDLGAERREHARTQAKLDATEFALGKFTKASGGQPPAPTVAPVAQPTTARPGVLTDAEALEKFEAMSPNEKALLMMKATPAAWLTPAGPVQAATSARQ